MALAITQGDRAAQEWLKAVRGGEGAEATFRALREYCALGHARHGGDPGVAAGPGRPLRSPFHPGPAS
jgi:hypothetical protein